MSARETINTPGGILSLAIVVGLVGAILMYIGDRMLKAKGLDIDEYNRRTSYRRQMGPLEQLNDFYSDTGNIPALLGMNGMIMLFAAAAMGIFGLGWLLLGWLGIL